MKHYFTALETPAIDSENGIIRTVSLIELGDAKGHFDKKGRQVIVDDTTLEQIFRECKKLGTIKVKADHGSGVFEIVGWADNFSLTANKVTADVHLYESEPNRPRLLEIAEKNPTHMGISMEFTGEDKPRGTVCMSRCDGIVAAALVDDPAANSSLFSVPVTDESTDKNEPDTNMDDDKTPQDKPSVEDRLNELASKFEELATKFTAKFGADEPDGDEAPPADAPPAPPATDPADEPAGSDPKKTYSEDEVTKVAELAAERAIKSFASKIGVANLGKPGSPPATAPKEKHFEEFVAEVATANHKGDQTAARAHVLTNLSKNPEWAKAYAATRNVKTA